MTDYIFGAMIASGGPNNQGLLGANGRISTTTLFANTANIGVANIASVSFTNLSVGNAITFGDGTVLQTAASSVSVYNYTGNGVTTTFATGNQSATSVNATMVFIGGVYQRKNQYTWIGTNIIFNAAPPVATNIEIQISTAATNILVPNDASVTPAKLSTGGPSWDVNGNLTVTGNVQATSFSPVGTTLATNGMFGPAASTLGFSTSGAERMRIDSAGQVGIATTSVNSRFQVRAAVNQNFNVSGAVSLANAVALSATNDAYSANVPLEIRYATNTAWYDGGTERMRLSSGALGLGNSPFQYGASGNVAVEVNVQSTNTSNCAVSVQAGLSRYFVGTCFTTNALLIGGNGASMPAPSQTPIVVNASGNVGIQTTSTPLTLTVAGDIAATRNVFSNYSDLRLKTKVGDIESALDKVEAIDTLYYEPNQTALDLGAGTGRSVGVSAQSVQAVMPETIGPSPLDTQYMTVQYERLVPLLIAAIKELRAEVRQLRSGA